MHVLEVRLFGGFNLRRDAKSITISSRPAQSLFAYLLLNAGTPHRREKLAGMMWPDSLEETARDNLRHALWRLRKALQSASAAHFLHANDLTIGFEKSSDYWFDVSKLENLTDATQPDQLMDALSEYRGELLPGFYDEWVLLEREHLYSLYEHHMARLLALLEDEKRWLDVMDWGERWIKLGQKPEPAYRALMSAHAAKGDMSKVAATYQRCVNSLRELGMDPSEQTRLLYERLKERQTPLETGSTIAPKEKRKEFPRTNLPVPLTSFIGREREVEEVKHLLSATRLLTLTGTGGIGKTRLAIHVAKDLINSYQDGVWWVELAPVTSNRLIAQAIANGLGVSETPSEPLTESLKRFLREKQVLLILDNCEHVIAACAQLANDLVMQCAGLSILATSREALGITGEIIMLVPTLSFPLLADLTQIQNLKEFESIQLFIERAAAVNPGLTLTQEHAFAVTQICHRLDGIPLAIELAAARIKIFSLEEIAARLDDRFTLLAQGSRTALPRHQTLRALVEWSYDLLSDLERVLWRRLSVFIGGWTLEAAESVCTDEILRRSQALELLSNLVDKSLVFVEEQNGSTRYRMLETLRQYGQEKLQLSDEEAWIRSSHLAFFLSVAEKASSMLLTIEQKKWFAELDAEYSNLRSAFEWAMESDIVHALRLTIALSQYWEVRGYIGEGRTALDRALEQARDVPKKIRADALRWQAKFAARQGDYIRAKEPLEESLLLARELGDQRGIARSLHNSGMVYVLQGDYSAAKASYEEGLAILQELDDKRELAGLTTSLGNVTNYMGDYESARQYQEKSVNIFRELGDKFGLFIALNNLGIVLERQGDHPAAQRYYEESIATAYELGEKNLVAYALNSLAHVVYLQGDPIGARRYYRESLGVFQEIGEKRGIVYCLEGFAKVAARYGNAAQAAHLLGFAETLRQLIGAPLNGAERSELEQDVVITRGRLGERIHEAAWAEGRAMTLEQAIDFALDGTK